MMTTGNNDQASAPARLQPAAGRGWLLGCFLLLPGLAAASESVRFGQTNFLPGTTFEFLAPLAPKAKWEAGRAGFPNLMAARGAIMVPQGFIPNQPWPMVIVSAGSGEPAIRMVRAFTNAAAKEAWVVLAADGPPIRVEADTHAFRLAMLFSVLDHLHRCWPLSRTWPLACAGFSGGAKRSCLIACALAKEKYSVIGLFMGGCNEDRLSPSLQLYYPGEPFKQIQVFLSNGAADPIAGPSAQAAIKASLAQSGLQHLRAELFSGEHWLHAPHVLAALHWFRPGANAGNSP